MSSLASLSIKFVLVLLFTSCNTSSNEKAPGHDTKLVNIFGRKTNTSNKRPPIYQVQVPAKWVIKEPSLKESLIDTKKPIYEITLTEGEQKALITIHNFPADDINHRVPPEAQVTRWKQQLGGDKAKHLKLTPQSFAGFSGLRFEGVGNMSETECMVIGWSMQISPEHFYSLSQEHQGISNEEREQMRSDFTIKAVATPEIMMRNKDDINRFARSFRLIKPIPDKR